MLHSGHAVYMGPRRLELVKVLLDTELLWTIELIQEAQIFTTSMCK